MTTSIHILFVSSLLLGLLKNMILTLPNPPENERSFRFSLESFLSKEQFGLPIGVKYICDVASDRKNGNG
jgi:hypothetical protein